MGTKASNLLDVKNKLKHIIVVGTRNPDLCVNGISTYDVFTVHAYTDMCSRTFND